MDIGSRLLLAASTNKSSAIAGDPIPTSWAYSDNLSGWFSTWGSKYDAPSIDTAECTLKYIKYANGIFMAVSGKGRIATSSDNGQTWTYRPNGRRIWQLNWPSHKPVSVEYGNGMWIVMEVYGRYMYSTDNGVNWLPGATSANYAPHLIYGNKWVRAGDFGSIHYSTDGLTWSSTFVGGTIGTFGLWACCWSPGLQKYIAVSGPDGKSAWSLDGITWTIDTQLGLTGWGRNRNPYLIGSSPVPAVANSNRVFIHDGAGYYAYTDDGSNWTAYSDLGYSTRSWIKRIEHNYYGWMYPQSGTTTPNRPTLFATLNTGWTDFIGASLRPFPNHGYSGEYTAIGPNGLPDSNINTLYGSTAGFITTNDGTTYNDNLSKFYSYYGFERSDFQRVFKSTEGYYVVYCNGSKVAISYDGSNWMLMQTTPDKFVNDSFVLILDKNAVTGKFTAFGQSGKIYNSSDLATWTEISSVAIGKTAIYGLMAGNRYVIGHVSGYISYSDDNGLTWTVSSQLRDTSWSTRPVTGLAWDGTTIMATGQNGIIATSTDGINWTMATRAGSQGGCIATNGSIFVKVDTGLYSYVSADVGQTWTQSASVGILLDVQYSQRLQKFVACGGSLGIYYSSDGLTWAKATTGISTSAVTSVASATLTSSADGKVFVGNNATCIVGT